MLTLTPPGDIDPVTGVKISHNHSTAVDVTATNENGVSQTFRIDAGETITWIPPAGWREVTFRRDGWPDVHRYIASEASGEA